MALLQIEQLSTLQSHEKEIHRKVTIVEMQHREGEGSQ